MSFFPVPAILIIAWRRPHTLHKVIDAIRPVAPSRIFVACDGPNPDRPGEADKVADTRKLIEQEINWPCNIERLYADENQGCRLGVSRAITWFFEHVEEGIILEDDCVPHADFIPYCAELLERYREDERIWCICGNNFQDGQWRGDGSYYFSRYFHCWGWASWRRCWRQYDSNLTKWPLLKEMDLMEGLFENKIERDYWTAIWDRLVDQGQPDTWDYQLSFTCFINGGLTLLPNENLVSNVGFGSDGTNCTMDREPMSYGKENLLPLVHPSFILRDTQADQYTFDSHMRNGQVQQVTLSFLLSLVKSRLRLAIRSPGHYPRKLLALARG